jgi:virginiamycin B lyase
MEIPGKMQSPIRASQWIRLAALLLSPGVCAWPQSGTYSNITSYPIPTPSSGPQQITTGPDGALWFTELVGQIGRLTTTGAFTEYPVSGEPFGIAAGPDGALWFTVENTGQIGRITTDGAITEYSVGPVSFPKAQRGAYPAPPYRGGTH